MKIAIGSDHRGFEAKDRIKAVVQGLGIEVVDHGTNSRSSCDYPEKAFAVASDGPRSGVAPSHDSPTATVPSAESS